MNAGFPLNPRRAARRLAGMGLVWAAGLAGAFGQYLEPPQQLTYTLPRLRYIKLDVEAEQTGQRGNSSGSETRFQRLYVAPSLGIAWNYFVYHPDLLDFSILAEPGYIWQTTRSSGATSGENDLLLNGT